MMLVKYSSNDGFNNGHAQCTHNEFFDEHEAIKHACKTCLMNSTFIQRRQNKS